MQRRFADLHAELAACRAEVADAMAAIHELRNHHGNGSSPLIH